jgi:hypothetical protein
MPRSLALFGSFMLVGSEWAMPAMPPGPSPQPPVHPMSDDDPGACRLRRS